MSDALVSRPHESERTLAEFFQERAISVGTMDRSLQVLTAAAQLAMVGSAVLVGLREAGLPTIPLGSEEGLQSTMPRLTFWASVVLVSLAWSYVLGGVLHAHRLVRPLALGAFSYAAYELWNVLPLGSLRLAPSYALLAVVWLAGLASLRERPEERGAFRALRLHLVPFLFVLVLALYLAFWWRTRPYHDPRFFTLAFFHQLEVCSFALIPVLLVAGVDFAEWGDATATRVTALARRLRPAVTLPLLAAGCAAGILAYRAATGGAAAEQARSAGLAAAFLALAALAAAGLHRTDAHVPYAAVFGSALALMGIVLGISYSVTGSSASAAASHLVYRHETAPRFQLSYPLSWLPEELPPRSGIDLVVFTVPASGSQFYVIHVPKPVLAVVPDPRSVFFKGAAGASERDGPWRRVRFRVADGNEGVSWQRTDGSGMWLLVGLAGPKAFAQVEPSFEEAKASWTTELSAAGGGEGEGAAAAEPRFTTSDRAIEGATLGWLGLALAAAAGLALARRRAAPGWVAPSLVFVVVAGLYWTFVQLPTVGYTLFGASSRTAWPQLTLRGLELTLAAATLLALATRAGRRAAGPLIGVNLGLFAVYWLDRAISSGTDAGRMSLVQAVLVLVALVWDVVMSGEAITNRHNRRFPRHARVLVYLGYLVAVNAAVLFFSSIHTVEGSVEPLFESEGFADTGLLFLGTSLVVTLGVLRLSRLRRAAA